jgi:dephospho-CoA kinase
MSPVIGLTGPIGCGKSTIAAHLADLGGYVIDADALARDMTAPGRPILDAVVARFGSDVIADDGGLDRPAMAAVAFGDAAALRDLEAIIQPEVRRMVEAGLASRAASESRFVVIEAIALVEGGLAARCDEVWLVVCDRPTQRDRLAARGMSAADAEARFEVQADIVERLAPAATRIVRTDGPLDSAFAAVDAALESALGAHDAT